MSSQTEDSTHTGVVGGQYDKVFRAMAEDQVFSDVFKSHMDPVLDQVLKMIDKHSTFQRGYLTILYLKAADHENTRSTDAAFLCLREAAMRENLRNFTAMCRSQDEWVPGNVLDNVREHMQTEDVWQQAYGCSGYFEWANVPLPQQQRDLMCRGRGAPNGQQQNQPRRRPGPLMSTFMPTPAEAQDGRGGKKKKKTQAPTTK